MDIKRYGFVLIAFLAVFSFSFASAEIMVSPSNSFYNLGDDLNLEFSLNPRVTTNDFFTARLVCSSGEVELMKSPQRVLASETKKIQMSVKLDKFLIGDLD